jgi:hypothetical protein
VLYMCAGGRYVVLRVPCVLSLYNTPSGVIYHPAVLIKVRIRDGRGVGGRVQRRQTLERDRHRDGQRRAQAAGDLAGGPARAAVK